MAAIIGKLRPVSKQPGSLVIGSTIIGTGFRRVQITWIGSESFLA